ncbi:MAG: class I adenylate-forming enzyme family protein [Ruminiclostridium sp.]
MRLKKGANIAVLAPNSRDAAELFLAIPAAGFTVMMLPAATGEKELAGIIEKYDIETLFAAEGLSSVTTGVSCPVFMADSIGETEAEFAEVSKQTPAAIFLTGGTSGTPKDAVLSHGALMRGAFNGVFGPGHVLKRRYMALLPFSHVFGSIRGLLSCLYSGSSVYLCTDLKAAIMDIPLFRPTTLVLVPGMIEIILGIAKLKGKPFLGDLKVIISGAAPVAPRLMQDCASFGIKVCPGYGLTECANLTAGNNNAEDFPEAVGPVYRGQEIKLIDGELYIKGDNVMLGYYGEPELTAQVLSDGWFRTGDLAELREYKQEKFLVITGRVKNLILLPNGENVSPEELESLFDKNPLVKDCLVRRMTINGNNVIGIEIMPFMPAFAGCSGDETESRLQSIVNEVNMQLPTNKLILKLVVRTEDFKRSGAMKILREQ